MDHERGDLHRDHTVAAVASADGIVKAVADMSEDEFTDWLMALPPPPELVRTPEEDEASLARARQQIAEGRGVPHEVVAGWLKTFGSPDRKPFPREWLE